jgi:hypothetical protein
MERDHGSGKSKETYPETDLAKCILRSAFRRNGSGHWEFDWQGIGRIGVSAKLEVRSTKLEVEKGNKSQESRDKILEVRSTNFEVESKIRNKTFEF